MPSPGDGMIPCTDRADRSVPAANKNTNLKGALRPCHPKPASPPQDRRERAPGDYYYDDATGYETYQPEEVDEGEAGEDSAGGARDEDVVQSSGEEENARSRKRRASVDE